MLHDEARKKITIILGRDIRFDGHFDDVFDSLKSSRQEQLIKWVKECKENQVYPISSYKVAGLLGFVLRFRDTNFRAILTKKKNEYFIALFLDKHKYYENERSKLGI